MAELFRPPYFQPDNVNGVPLAGALLYFYAAGTTTPITVYQDNGLITPHASPVVADASGIFPAIYVNSATYKIILQTSLGVVVKTYDNINSTSSVTVSDANFRIQDDGDPTKQLAFQVSGLTTGTTRTLTVQDADGTIPVIDNSGTFTISGASVGLTPFRGTSTDASASAGPIFEWYRDSASPAASDLIGQAAFYGRDSAGNKQLYGYLQGLISDPTTTTERGGFNLYTTQNGSDNLTASFGASGTASTATAAGTTTLTKISAPVQKFTGVLAQTCVLPVVAELFIGQPYTIINLSTGAVTVQSSGANLVAVVAPGMQGVFTANANSGTGASVWDFQFGRTLTLGTPVASTSGTSIDFTGLPTWIRRVTMSLVGMSTNGTALKLVQIGDAGGIETSGYLGASANVGGAGAANSTAGLLINSGSAADVHHGTVTMTLENATNNTWAMTHLIGVSSGAAAYFGASSKSLSPGPLDRVRLTTVGGTDTFDAGEINITYE